MLARNFVPCGYTELNGVIQCYIVVVSCLLAVYFLGLMHAHIVC